MVVNFDTNDKLTKAPKNIPITGGMTQIYETVDRKSCWVTVVGTKAYFVMADVYHLFLHFVKILGGEVFCV